MPGYPDFIMNATCNYLNQGRTSAIAGDANQMISELALLQATQPGGLNAEETALQGLLDSWLNLDGRQNATPGAAPYPNAFNSYVPSGVAPGRYYLGGGGGRQPPWHVPGVDYNVGLPSGLTLQDPTVAALPNGATYNPGSRFIRCNNDNTVFNGWDFSAPGLDGQGVSLYTGGANNTVVKNCKFFRGQNLVNAGNQFVIQCPNGNITVSYCTIDDGGVQMAGTAGVVSPPFFGGSPASGTATQFIIEYCWVKNIICGHPWEIGVQVIDQFNLYDTLGWAPWAHGNGGLFVGSNQIATPAQINNSKLQFRFFRGGSATQVGGFPLGLCENWQAQSNNFTNLSNTTIAYNAAINPSYSTPCYITHISGATNSLGPNTNVNTTIHDNFVDPGDALGYNYFAGPDTSTGMNVYNIKDMTTGIVQPRSPTTFTNTSFTFSHTQIANGFAVGQVQADQSPTLWAIFGPVVWSDGGWAPNAITGAAFNSGSGTITWTTTSAHGVNPNQRFVILGAAPNGYNGQFTSGSATAGTTLVSSGTVGNPGANTTPGTLQAGGAGFLGYPGYCFSIDNSGNITINSTGAASGFLTAGTYQINVGAANSGGSNTTIVTITIT